MLLWISSALDPNCRIFRAYTVSHVATSSLDVRHNVTILFLDIKLFLNTMFYVILIIYMIIIYFI